MGEEYADLRDRSTPDNVAQLERDSLAVYTTIREWTNTFAPINRVPSDVLSLIPTHLPSQGDQFRASFVCRHWRRTFLRNAALWSRLRLSKGEAYMKTLLERAKGSPLTILASHMDPVDAIRLLSPCANQIIGLEFAIDHWGDIHRFSEIISGPLPFLRTLEIDTDWEIGLLPIAKSTAGLKEFRLHLRSTPILGFFSFPNLTSFELSVVSAEVLCGSQLLKFLKASPMLRAVRFKIIAPISLDDIPQETVIVLHNVETFCLVARDGGSSYELATHISCPSAKHTSFTHARESEHYLDTPREKFPEASWKTIVRQYTTSPIEEVTFETTSDSDYLITCSLTFQSVDSTVIKLHFEVAEDRDPDIYELETSFTAMYLFTFCGASQTIGIRSPLANIKRLHMYGPRNLDDDSWIMNIGDKFRELIESLRHLEELTICRCDMRPYPFVYWGKRGGYQGQVSYPPIKALTISYPSNIRNGEFVEDLVELARGQHERGMPFERVTIRMYGLPAEMEKSLRPWVGTVDCVGVSYRRD